MTSPILVTGGTGTLGRLVVARLRDTGCDVRMLSRHHHESDDGLEFIPGDLATGKGIEPAVEGTKIIVHLAGSATGDEGKTRHLVQAASQAGASHLVYISVVGAGGRHARSTDRRWGCGRCLDGGTPPGAH